MLCNHIVKSNNIFSLDLFIYIYHFWGVAPHELHTTQGYIIYLFYIFLCFDHDAQSWDSAGVWWLSHQIPFILCSNLFSNITEWSILFLIQINNIKYFF